MSENYLRLIPTDPAFVPTAEARELAAQHFTAFLPVAQEITAEVTDEIEFIDAGANFETVACPLCTAELDIDWWGEVMDTACETEFRQLDVTVPCCQGATTLNDLTYRWPQGFARFVLDARSPCAGAQPGTDQHLGRRRRQRPAGHLASPLTRRLCPLGV